MISHQLLSWLFFCFFIIIALISLSGVLTFNLHFAKTIWHRWAQAQCHSVTHAYASNLTECVKQNAWIKTCSILTKMWGNKFAANGHCFRRWSDWNGSMNCFCVTKLSETTGPSFISCTLSKTDFRGMTCLHLLLPHLSPLSHNDICHLSTTRQQNNILSHCFCTKLVLIRTMVLSPWIQHNTWR